MHTTLQAPLSGWALPLSEVPDPVFSQGLAGPGYAIDPSSNRLVAPCDGQIVQVHRCLHALTLRRPDGLEVLMHVGIDTVQLAGRGFSAKVRVGDQVQAGALLLEFDPDLIASHCRSLVTVILLPENPSGGELQATLGTVEQGQPWMTVRSGALPLDPPQSAVAVLPEQAGNWLELPNPSGLHARPAARLLALVRDWPGTILLESDSGKASARSLVALLGLGLRQGERLRVLHQQLSPAQLEQLQQEITSGLGDDLRAPAAPLASATAATASLPEGALPGVVASRGLALGTIVHWRRAQFELPTEALPREEEERQFTAALQQAATQVRALQQQAPRHEQGIFGAHLEILSDPEMIQQSLEPIAAGRPAARAWQEAFETQARALESLPNPLLAARASDLRDVGERVLRCLVGAAPIQQSFPEGSIVVARDLNPSDTVQLDRQRVKGLCLAQGGPTSHVAILARSLGLPALCALGSGCLKLKEGQEVVVEAENGYLLVAPTPEQRQQALARLEQLNQQRQQEKQHAHQPALTQDGVAIEVAVNIGGLSDLEEGLEQGAEGVGLFRSEFYFHGLSQEPDHQQQVEVYRSLAQQLGPNRRLVARLLDVGGDKPLSYVPMMREENPFLGVRGIRLFARQPQLFRNQIRALLEVTDLCQLALLVPMVTTLGEWRAIRQEILQLAQGRPVELGVMVEVPSAALLAPVLAEEVDFFSIGTNDLSQYTMAIDRSHPDLAGQVDAVHPALLQLIQRVGEAAQAKGRWVGVCGGAAQDLEAVPLLLGLGVRELSLSPPAVASVKAEIRRWSLSACQQLAQAALRLGDAEQVRQLVRETAS